MAEVEAADYAEVLGDDYLGFAQAYHLSESPTLILPARTHPHRQGLNSTGARPTSMSRPRASTITPPRSSAKTRHTYPYAERGIGIQECAQLPGSGPGLMPGPGLRCGVEEVARTYELNRGVDGRSICGDVMGSRSSLRSPMSAPERRSIHRS